MATVFCSHCGYVVARGDFDDPGQAVRDSGHSACPGCGSASGIGWSPSELSDEEVRRAVSPAAASLGAGGESLTPLADLIAMEAMGDRSHRAVGRWLLRIGLVMLVVGVAAGVLFLYLWDDWFRAVVGGVVAAFTAAWVVDKVVESPLD